MFDVVFLSHWEPHAEAHWRDLSRRFPSARRVDGVQGIRAAHAAAGAVARTSMVWVVDADNAVEPGFGFDRDVPSWNRGYVHLFYARNPVNGLEYGWGGIKLFPRALLRAADEGSAGLDMTAGFPLKIVPEVASVTHFNTSPEAAWRSAFREAVKLSVSRDPDAPGRLAAWRASDRGAYAGWVRRGAEDGIAHAATWSEEQDELARINDWGWLATRFAALAETAVV